MSELKKENLNIFIILIMLITGLVEFAYGLFYAKINDEGYILIQETLTFFVLQILVYLVLILTKVLSTEKNLNIYIGTLGLTHSWVMAFLVAQRISTKVNTLLLVLGLFLLLHLLIILFLKFWKRQSHEKTPNSKKNAKTPSKSMYFVCFVGVFAGMLLSRKLGNNVIVFDVVVSILSIVYSTFYFVAKPIRKTKREQDQSGDGSMIDP